MSDQPGVAGSFEFLFPVVGGEGMDAPQFDTWLAFNRGIRPGIHPEHWPESLDSALRNTLRDDHRAVRHLFCGRDGFPAWTPSWHRDQSDPVVTMLLDDPRVIPRLHLLLCGAVARNSLARLISARDRKSARDFLGARIHDMALFIMKRWELPSLEPWIPSEPVWSSPAQLSMLGGNLLEGALSSAPATFRNQIFLALPPSAKPSKPVDDPQFRECASTFILKVVGEGKDILTTP